MSSLFDKEEVVVKAKKKEEPPAESRGQNIIDMREGDQVKGIYALAGAELRDFRDGRFLSVKLGDSTGKIKGIMWDGCLPAYEKLTVGDIVRVRGRVGSYQGQRQIQVGAIEKVEDLTGIDPSSFLPACNKDVNTLRARMRELAESITDEHLRMLVIAFLDDEAFFNCFSKAPGGKQWHHAYVGGLLEHTVSMMEIADFFCTHYANVDRNVVMAGTALHDVGKIAEFEYQTVIGYTDEGRLLGHIILGDEMVCAKIAQIEGFPRERATLVRHLILSHHGDRGNDTPRQPMTLEAIVLHCCDYVDSQMAAYTREITRAQELGKRWTDYVNLIDRYLFAGEPPPNVRNAPPEE